MTNDEPIEINGFSFKPSEITQVTISRNGASTTINRPAAPKQNPLTGFAGAGTTKPDLTCEPISVSESNPQ